MRSRAGSTSSTCSGAATAGAACARCSRLSPAGAVSARARPRLAGRGIGRRRRRLHPRPVAPERDAIIEAASALTRRAQRPDRQSCWPKTASRQARSASMEAQRLRRPDIQHGGGRNLLDVLDIAALADFIDTVARARHDGGPRGRARAARRSAAAAARSGHPRVQVRCRDDRRHPRADPAGPAAPRARKPAKVDYRLATARAEPRGAQRALDRIFVHDFVLPMRDRHLRARARQAAEACASAWMSASRARPTCRPTCATCSPTT